MKKILAVILLLAMLIPMGLVNVVSGAEAEVKPFYFINNKGELDTGAYAFDDQYVYSRVNFSTSRYKGEGELPVYINLNVGGTLRDIPQMAQKLKEIFDGLPKGARYIMLYKTIDTNVQPEAMIYMDKGVELYAQWAEEFFKEYKAIGGELDGVMLDVEYNFTHAYYLYEVYRSGTTILDEDGTKTNIPANPEIYKQIVEHPKYAEVRPLLEERGFTFIQGSANKSEIFNITDVDSTDAKIWDAVMHNRQVAYMEQAIAPALKYFPDVMVTNYTFSSGKAWNASVNSLGGNTDSMGTTTNEEYYVRRPASSYYDTSKGFNNPVTYNNAVFADTTYHSFLYGLNSFKSMYDSSDNKRISAFIAGFNYLDRNRPANGTRLTPYYSETILHIGMLNPEVFLGYIVGPRDTSIDGEPYDYDDVIEVVSELMCELTRVAGFADRKAIYVPKTWNSSFTLSGMYAGGRNIWRLTPDTSRVSLENFKIEGADPTFRVDGQTVTFPGGKIIADSQISHIGTCGYWIETPADVMPVVTSDVNRYSQFPAFGENFNGYQTGMEYSYYNVEFPTSWKFKAGKGTTAIVEDDKNVAGNKVLALNGDIHLQNVNILKNVTAGDTYAEGQTWEVTVTVPADMGADAKITLLSINDDKGKVVDGGFQIAGGKLSYYNADQYVELADVDIAAGGKFTFKREMDFNTADAFTCTYTVYDATGKELASVKNVPVAKNVKVPVQAIGLNFSKVNGTVYVDDYKLYASGVATDFMLYDVKTGIRATDLNQARATNTAYRLSWLNGTASEKVYSVVAAFYNGDKLVEEKVIKEVKMAPNTDSVETGIVEVAEGQSVRVYLRDDSPNSSSNNGNAGNSGNTSSDSTVMLIAIIAGVVILLAVALLVIVIVSIKKKAPAAAEEKAEEANDETAE